MLEDETPELIIPAQLEGYLLKAGLKGFKSKKKRWFSTEENRFVIRCICKKLTRYRLRYYKNRHDKDPIGVIPITSTTIIEPESGE